MSEPSTATTTDVLILGGGLSGLAAALSLKAAGKPFLLLEGRKHLGGRARTESASGPIDVGAEYFGPAQRLITHFVERFGVATFKTFLPPDKKWLFQDAAGAVTAYDALHFPGGMSTSWRSVSSTSWPSPCAPTSIAPRACRRFSSSSTRSPSPSGSPRRGP